MERTRIRLVEIGPRIEGTGRKVNLMVDTYPSVGAPRDALAHWLSELAEE